MFESTLQALTIHGGGTLSRAPTSSNFAMVSWSYENGHVMEHRPKWYSNRDSEIVFPIKQKPQIVVQSYLGICGFRFLISVEGGALLGLSYVREPRAFRTCKRQRVTPTEQPNSFPSLQSSRAGNSFTALLISIGPLREI